MTSPTKVPLRFIVYLILVGALIAIFIPVFRVRLDSSPLLRQTFNAHHLYVLLLDYAKHHGGKFPASLLYLPHDPLRSESWQFRDPKTGRSEEWIYLKGYTLKDPGSTIILASPRTVVFAGCPGRIVFCIDIKESPRMDEDVFVQRISEQLNSRSLDR